MLLRERVPLRAIGGQFGRELFDRRLQVLAKIVIGLVPAGKRDDDKVFGQQVLRATG